PFAFSAIPTRGPLGLPRYLPECRVALTGPQAARPPLLECRLPRPGRFDDPRPAPDACPRGRRTGGPGGLAGRFRAAWVAVWLPFRRRRTRPQGLVRGGHGRPAAVAARARQRP